MMIMSRLRRLLLFVQLLMAKIELAVLGLLFEECVALVYVHSISSQNVTCAYCGVVLWEV